MRQLFSRNHLSHKTVCRTQGVLLCIPIRHQSHFPDESRQRMKGGRPRGIDPEIDPAPTFDQALKYEHDRNIDRTQQLSAQFKLVEDSEIPSDAVTIGIDLGTSNSCLSYFSEEKGRPVIIPNKTGSWVFPTVVSFQKQHHVRLFGEEARVASKSNPGSALSSGKRLIGRRYGELSRVRAQHERTNQLVFSSTGEPSVQVEGRQYSVVHVTGMFLRHLKNSAEEHLKKPVAQCVVSVPAYFTPSQKVATEDAALIAGFDVLEVVDEPTAACLTYTLLGNEERKHLNKDVQHYFVIDLGGGTLDCAVMRYRRDEDVLSVIGTHGDPILGGNDWDNVLMKHFVENFRKQFGIDLDDGDPIHAGEIRIVQLEAEKAKIAMTTQDVYTSHTATFHFDQKRRDCLPLSIRLDRSRYEALTRDLVDRCIRNVHATLEKVNLKVKDIDDVLLVGGMTRDPPFQEGIAGYFRRNPVSSSTCPPDYAVAMGAAVRAAMLKGQLKHLKTHTEFDIAPTTQVGKLMAQARKTLGLQSTIMTAVRWRGRAQGLSESEIKKYAMEIVEHEAQGKRRIVLDELEELADDTLQRLARHADFRQGEIEQQAKVLQEQVKFWQYMVHQFHSHEEALRRAVTELTNLLDDYEGIAPENPKARDDSGRVVLDQSKVLRKVAAKKLPEGKTNLEDRFHSSRATLPTAEVTKDNRFTEALQEMVSREPPPPPGEDKSVHHALRAVEEAHAQEEADKQAEAKAKLRRDDIEDMEGLLREFQTKFGPTKK
eukprot:PhF_6_TR35366/c0_g1_i1/m.51356/K04043/dnaK, HSPA9; molecular chaperone DnaK